MAFIKAYLVFLKNTNDELVEFIRRKVHLVHRVVERMTVDELTALKTVHFEFGVLVMVDSVAVAIF